MNIHLKISSPTHFGDYSTFEIGIGYDAGVYAAVEDIGAMWNAYIIKAKPHVQFRHEGVFGGGKTIEQAVKDLSNSLQIRLQVAMETRASQQEIQDLVFDAYSKAKPVALKTMARTTIERVTLSAVEDEVKAELFKKGWTFKEYCQREGINHEADIGRRKEVYDQMVAMEQAKSASL